MWAQLVQSSGIAKHPRLQTRKPTPTVRFFSFTRSRSCKFGDFEDYGKNENLMSNMSGKILHLSFSVYHKVSIYS